MNYTRIYLFLVTFFVLNFFLVSCSNNDKNNEYLDVKYKISDSGVSVSLSENNLADSIVMRYPIYMPGTYSPTTTPLKIKTLSDNNSKCFIDSANRIAYFYSKNTDKIKYFVESSAFTTDNIMVNGIFINKDLVVLNHNVLLGIIPKYKNKKIRLTIIKNEKYNNISTSKFKVLDKNTDVYTYNSYEELYDNPIIYSSKDEKFKIKSNGITFNIGFYAPLKKITSADLSLILKPTIDAISKNIKFCYNNDTYDMVFIFNNMVNEGISYSTALEHKKSSVYCFFAEPNLKEKKDSIRFAENLKTTVAHECMHLFIPLSFADSLTTNFDYFREEHSQNLLLYEGFTEYQSLKLLLNDRLISDSTFINIMYRKIARFDIYMKMKYLFNLNELSKNIYKKPNWLGIYYSRGAVLAFLLDINIIKYTNGKDDLFSILKDIAKNNKTFNNDDIYNELIKRIPKLKTFIELYIFGKKYPILKNELLKSGLSYNKVIPKQKYFYPFSIVNKYNTQPKIYVYKKNYSIPKDTFTVKSINNNTNLNSFIFNIIHYNAVNKDDKCKITLEKNGIIETKDINPMSKDYPMIPWYPNIYINKNKTTSQQIVFNKLFYNK